MKAAINRQKVMSHLSVKLMAVNGCKNREVSKGIGKVFYDGVRKGNSKKKNFNQRKFDF